MTSTLTHGTASGYTHHGCRCDACREARNAYRRSRYGKTGLPKECPCATPDGRQFRSQAAAASALGIHPRRITYHLDRYGDLSRIGQPQRHSKGGHPHPVRIGPREWPSRKALADHIGRQPATVRRWISQGHMECLLSALMAADAREAARAAKAAERRSA